MTLLVSREGMPDANNILDLSAISLLLHKVA
jgi:hypothetical protein